MFGCDPVCKVPVKLVQVISPTTSNSVEGASVPIPTFPSALIINFLEERVVFCNKFPIKKSADEPDVLVEPT